MSGRSIFALVMLLICLALSTAHADTPPVLGDRVFGGIGVDVTLDYGRLVVSRPLDGLPAAKSGIRAGDEIVSVDGHPVDTSSLEAGCRGLSGAVGSRVVLGVRHKGSKKVDLLTVERAPLVASAVTFSNIPTQVVEGVFQITLHVVDSSGRPLPNADVEVKLDPAYTSAHFLFISTRIYLKNAGGYVVPALTARTDANGDALLWVRLNSATTPFRARLSATVTYESAHQGPILSNVFSVDRRDND